MNRKTVVIGSLNYDVCLKQERLPVEGETYFADSVNYCSGGKGGNQAVQAAKLGVPTYMVGCIGDDTSGVFLKENIEKYGVHTDYLKIRPGNSGMSVAQSLYDGGVRASVVRGTNDLVTKEDVDELDGFLNPGDIVVFQLEIPISTIEYAIHFCKEKGCVVILNGAPASEVSEETLKEVDYFVVNELEAGFFCKKPIEDKETAGAGNSFIGGLCYALTENMDIFEAAKFATCCSAKTVCKIGGQPSMPFLDEVMELYNQK